MFVIQQANIFAMFWIFSRLIDNKAMFADFGFPDGGVSRGALGTPRVFPEVFPEVSGAGGGEGSPMS